MENLSFRYHKPDFMPEQAVWENLEAQLSRRLLAQFRPGQHYTVKIVRSVENGNYYSREPMLTYGIDVEYQMVEYHVARMLTIEDMPNLELMKTALEEVAYRLKCWWRKTLKQLAAEYAPWTKEPK